MLGSLHPRNLLLLRIVVLGMSLVFFGERRLRQIGDFLITPDTLRPADVIHVIAGEDFRMDHAFQLYMEKQLVKAHQLLFVE